jgi:DNA-binding CsgD family transcriptional regulator
MPEIIRELTSGDVDAAFELLTTRPLFGPRFANMASKVAQCNLWRELLRRLALRGAVLIDPDRPAGERIVTFGFGGFVRPMWLKEFLEHPFPFVGAHVLEELLAGRDEILMTDEEVKEANSSTGLSALVLASGWQYSQESAPFAAKMGSVAAFQHAYRGFRMNEFVSEVASGPEADFCLSSSTWRERRRFRFAKPVGHSADYLVLLGITRLEAQESSHETSILSPLFVWREVRFGFTRHQQELLLLASSRASDKEIAKTLNIGPDAVGRRFDRIFRKVELLQNERYPVFPKGTSCFAKRNLLLDYLKDNIQELRPHNMAVGIKRRSDESALIRDY